MSSKEKSQGRLLEEELAFSYPYIAKAAPVRVGEAKAFCEDYKDFLTKGKTERECVVEIIARLEAAGYAPFDPARKYKAGDKVYKNNRGKSVLITTFGTKPASEGLRMNMAHIDCPRLDLKPAPLYEKNDLAFFKTHYYGGVRKYQWVTIPLALHGVIFKKNGEMVTICYGEDESEPVLYITDLLPHLAEKQKGRKLADGIRGEEMNVLVGTLPFPDEDVRHPVKLMVLCILNEKYGITEADFARAELEIVAAGPARDAGFDASLVMATGQDDRVCAYTALRADIDTRLPEHTTVTVLTDKEEIGSIGNTGLDSDYLRQYLQYLAENDGSDYRVMCEHTMCLSSDVNAGFDPTFPDVYDPLNSAYIGKGPTFMKYTGQRGKVYANDASAETMNKVIGIFEKEGVYWQISELGKVDEGGGGTVSKFVAGLNIDVVDIGVPVLAMHAPKEIVSKLDVYEAYKAYKAFYK